MRPLVYEINTRCWLHDLSAIHGKPITLGEIPNSEFTKWQSLGFTHIWLMGIWQTGPRARAEALRTPEQRRQYLEALPDFKDQDIQGSPYAIADYSVAEAFGSNEALKTFRRKLNQCGIKLILDFVPNHLGLDHPWVVAQPDLFVQSPFAAPGTFQEETSQGLRWLAHGKDPYFPPWTDTVQLDYRRRATQAAMLDLLASVAERCDGARCDMAMLVLNDVFAKNWERFPVGDPAPNFEFWEFAIPAIRATHHDFIFLAEVYWGLEERLQKMGFDYTYDKELYDRIVSHDPAGTQRHLLNQPIAVTSRNAHFLENHDERRIASVLDLAEHRAVALLILTLPGLCLLHEGQLTGATRRVPVQLTRRFAEKPQPEIVALYHDLLSVLRQTSIGKGTAKLLVPLKASDTDSTSENVVLIEWSSTGDEIDLVVINLSSKPSRCIANVGEPASKEVSWSLRDLLSDSKFSSQTVSSTGLLFELAPFETRILQVESTEHSDRASEPVVVRTEKTSDRPKKAK
jgi:glycosidase